MEEAQSPTSSPKIPDLCNGRPIAFHPSAHEKDKSDPLDIHMGASRWYVVGYSDRNSHEPQMIPKEFTRNLRSEPHFRDVDGACPRRSVIQKVRKRPQNIDPKFTDGQRLEQFYLGWKRVRFETCWYKSDNRTPVCSSDSRSLLKTTCEPRVLQKPDRNTARMDESFFQSSSQINKKRVSISSGIVLISFYNLPTKTSRRNSCSTANNKVLKQTNAQRSCTVNKETRTAQSSWS